MDIQLKVNTEKLREVSESVSGNITTINDNFNGIYFIVDSSVSYWDGAAADKARKLFNDKKESVNDIIKRLREHPRDLMTMAGVYDLAESESANISNTLTTDVIV